MKKIFRAFKKTASDYFYLENSVSLVQTRVQYNTYNNISKIFNFKYALLKIFESTTFQFANASSIF